MIRIVQYNILSTDLGTKFYFVNTDTKHLKPDFRWLLLKEKLLPEIHKFSIICLQEVCLYWLEKLIPFLQEVGYICHYNNYGWKDDGYMGVLITYPNTYKLEALKIINIGDSIESKTKIINSELELDKDDIWVKAIRKKNTMLCMRLTRLELSEGLSIGNKTFCIGTYHMPCFGDSIKILHMISCIQLLNKFAGNYKCIFAGDFNMMPNSTLYKIITVGGNYADLVDKSTNYDTSMFSFKVPMMMQSGYKLFGEDPTFTNYAHVANSEPFSGCLDYIFLSRGWKVTDVQKLPTELPKLTYPSDIEPSDHLLLAVNLELVERADKKIDK
jgi:mRNA deadenylase 3'-5' endonuclease subunit Ccr4